MDSCGLNNIFGQSENKMSSESDRNMCPEGESEKEPTRESERLRCSSVCFDIGKSFRVDHF